MQVEIIRSAKDAHQATGLAIVIDVFRAFTTQAYIFANGASKIIPVLSLEDAYNLKKENPAYILVGEKGGLKPEGFDFGNGPSEILNVDFVGKTIVHATSNGTKALVDTSNAEVTLSGSFVVADSIIKYINKHNIQNISLIATDPDSDLENEDILLAYYIRDVLNGYKINETEIKNKLQNTVSCEFLLKKAGVTQDEIDLCLDFHRFNFVIKKVSEDGLIYLIRENLQE